MFRTLVTGLALTALVGGAAFAKTFEVQMPNKGDSGPMVFEPVSLRISAGGTAKFIATDKGHNTETVKGMIPEPATPFAGKMPKRAKARFEESLSGP